MNIAISYVKFQLESLGPVAAACSRNVSLLESNNISVVLSGKSITCRSSIICFLLNINPLDVSCTNLLWHEKYSKPILYNFYKSTNFKIQDKSHINLIEELLNAIEYKFINILKTNITPLDLILWADLYLIFMDNSPFKLRLPIQLSKWFGVLNCLPQLQRAIDLVSEDVLKHIGVIVNHLPVLPIDKSELYVPEKTCVSHYNDDSSVNSLRIDTKEVFLNGSKKVAMPRKFSTPKLPVKDARNILITSALPYVNNIPHLGNLIGSTLSADVFSRFCRARGMNSIYICGTDEYGTTTEVKAAEEKLTPRQICDHYNAIHADVYKWFNIDFDLFGRTSTLEHSTIVTEVFQDIYKQGFIIKGDVDQLFCEACEKFLADRFVEGICPMCAFEDARGDQCDNCGKLINAAELKKPRCKMCNATPILRTSKHLFLDLSKIQSRLEEYLQDLMTSEDCVWSTNAKSITNSWLKEGLKPRCITRDLKWGVPVPLEDFKDKVFYVWFDAVLGYLSITSCYTAEWRQWWIKEKSKGPVEIYQFMAKDNVPFHSVIFPANLMASGQDWNMIKQLASTEYMNYENTKFSKSRGLGVFGNDAMESGIDADVWRFYLISSRPESQDSSFLWDDFAARNNSELLNNLGNFINRALSFVAKFYDSAIPDISECFDEEDLDFVCDVNRLIATFVENMTQIKLRESVSTILKISSLGNIYIQKNKPWVAVKSEETKKRAGTTIAIAANLACLLGVLVGPVMPVVGDKILDQCNAPMNCRQISDDCRFKAFLQPCHKIGAVVPLFVKVESDFIVDMKKKYSSA